MKVIDYSSPAELFMRKRTGRPGRRRSCRCFATAAEAIRFAVEDLPAVRTLGPCMHVGNEHFDADDIHGLYDRPDYPLRRRIG
jgi:hypothetical protein